MPDAPSSITEVCIDPKWTLGKSPYGPVLRIEHPQHGNIDCLLTKESMVAMWNALAVAIDA